MRRRLILGALALSSALVTPLALADQPTGNMLAGSCAACHGTNGNSVSIMPSLAGMNQEYFKETMEGESFAGDDVGRAEIKEARRRDRRAWFASLPEAVREAVKSRGKSTLPKGYEEVLKRYFEDQE